MGFDDYLVSPERPREPKLNRLYPLPDSTGDPDKDARAVFQWTTDAINTMNDNITEVVWNLALNTTANITPQVDDLNDLLQQVKNVMDTFDEAVKNAKDRFESVAREAQQPMAADVDPIYAEAQKLVGWVEGFAAPSHEAIGLAQTALSNLSGMQPNTGEAIGNASALVQGVQQYIQGMQSGVEMGETGSFSENPPSADGLAYQSPTLAGAAAIPPPPTAEAVVFEPHEIVAKFDADAPKPDIPAVDRNFTKEAPHASIAAVSTEKMAQGPNLDAYLATIAGAAPRAADVPQPPEADFAASVSFNMPAAPTVSFPASPAEKSFEFPNAPSVALPKLPAAPNLQLGEMPALSEIVLPSRPEIELPVWDAVKPNFELVAPSIGVSFVESGFVDATLEKLRSVLEHILDHPGEFAGDEAAVWERAQDRARWELDDSMNRIAADFGGRGFLFPPGAMAKAIEKARLEARKQLGEVNREIATRSVDRLLAERKFAVEQGNQIVQIDFNAYRDYQDRALKVATATVDASISLFNAQAQAANMKLEAWKTEASIFEARLRAEISRLDAYRTEMEAVRIQTDVDKARIDAYIATTNAMRAVVDIYNAQVGAAKVAAEMEQLKVELFRAQVGAVGDQIQAYTAQIGAYEARIRGESAKLSAWESQIRGETANTQAQREALQGNLDVYRAKISGYEAKLEAFKATLPVSDAVIRAAMSGIDGRMKQFDAEISRFRANLDRDKTVVETDAARVRANLDTFSADIRAFETQLRGDEVRTETEKSRYQAELSAFQAQIDKFKTSLELDEAHIRASSVALDAKAKVQEAGIRSFEAGLEAHKAALSADEVAIRAADTAVGAEAKIFEARLRGYDASVAKYRAELEKARVDNDAAARRTELEIRSAGESVDATIRAANAGLEIARQEYDLYAGKNRLAMDQVRMEYDVLLKGWEELAVMAQAGETDVRAQAAALEAKTKAYADIIAAASEAYEKTLAPPRLSMETSLKVGADHLELLRIRLQEAQNLIETRKSSSSQIATLYGNMINSSLTTMNTMINYT